MSTMVRTSQALKDVRYEIRGHLANRAQELERLGYEIISLNIGNPGGFGFRTPETMRLAMIENLHSSEGYCHQKGIFPAREAVVMQQQDRGILGVTAEDVFIGNGVSELIDLTLRALLNPGDEVLIPSPDYPLWTAGVTLNQGRPVHYPCPPENRFEPDLEAIVALAAKHQLMVMSDEIYDGMTYEGAEFVPMATLVEDTVCATFSGLSKVYRACGYRVGWVVLSGDMKQAPDYLNALELLASLRLCSNVPAQWAVQTALGGFQSIRELVAPGGRLFESRQAIIDAVEASRYLQLVKPTGSMYAFVGVDPAVLPGFDDGEFALNLLERKHVLVAPGVSFNVKYNNRFRITLLPDVAILEDVFQRIDELLDDFAADKL